MFTEIYLCFFTYAFFGWCAEVLYAALIEGKFVNRGFLSGPYCPIYGFGVIAVVNLMEPIHHNIFLLFIGSVFVTSTIELLTGFILEKIFRQRWWDYSDKPFNIEGYICPLFSLMWGLACLIVVDRIHPMVLGLINIIPNMLAVIILIVFTVAFIIDIVATANTIFKLNKKMARIEELSGKIRNLSDELGDSLASETISLVAKKEALEQKLDDFAEKRKKALEDMLNAELYKTNIFGSGRLMKAFPNWKPRDNKEAYKALKDYIIKKSQEKKN